MVKNKTALDRFFTHSTWVIKRFLTFVFILTILGVVLYNSSNPVWTSTYLGEGKTSVVIDLNKSGQTQFLIFPSNSNHDQYVDFKISLFAEIDGNWTFIKTFPSERVVHIISLDKGTYKLEFENSGVLRTNIEVVVAQADPTFLILFFGALVAFGIFLFLVQLIFPLYFILLVISLLRTPYEEEGVGSITRGTATPTKKGTSLLGIPEEDLTQNDKIGFAIAGLFVTIGLIGYAFPMILFGALIFVGTYTNAQNRSKLRKRFINFVNHPPYPHSYTLKEISFVLGEDIGKLETLVLHMALDLGYPLEYDKESQTVTVMESLTRPEIDFQRKITTINSQTEDYAIGEVETVEQVEQPAEGVFCVKCGVPLPDGAIFCYNCGSKNQNA
ncbi:MAG: zinc ribbon domain-containing protein [Methanobacteriota archaeon]|nr:MAG: zinc ribbon domain-containing protein [Euryarchaeota archaeon]